MKNEDISRTLTLIQYFLWSIFHHMFCMATSKSCTVIYRKFPKVTFLPATRECETNNSEFFCFFFWMCGAARAFRRQNPKPQLLQKSTGKHCIIFLPSRTRALGQTPEPYHCQRVPTLPGTPPRGIKLEKALAAHGLRSGQCCVRPRFR